jgi:ATP-dependent helicase/nuclease subunit A
MDRVMVRGRIDVLIPNQDGLILADFKSDQLTLQTVAARAEFYKPQIMAYRDAIAKITVKPVKSCYLVFLQPRVLSEV